MAKLIPDAIVDEQLGVIAAATILFICSDTPTTYANASATYDLATHVIVPTVGEGDFTISNGDTSGRKLILGAQAGITASHDGTATHYALGISATTTLLLVGTMTSQAVTGGNTVSFPATDILEIRDLA